LDSGERKAMLRHARDAARQDGDRLVMQTRINKLHDREMKRARRRADFVERGGIAGILRRLVPYVAVVIVALILFAANPALILLALIIGAVYRFRGPLLTLFRRF